jgi:subfamily B ATP-binding cassette protein MsbA
MDDSDITSRENLRSLRRVIRYQPLQAGLIIGLSLLVMVLEGVGLTFLYPIIEVAQNGGDLAVQTDGITGLFIQLYAVVGLPLTIEYLVVGIAAVMTVRYASMFLSRWLTARLTKGYERHLKTSAYELAMGASIPYYDDKGSDEILNTIVTETRYASRVISQIVRFVQKSLLCVVYVGLALAIAPLLMVGAGVVLGGFTYLIRNVVEPGYTVGERVATANEQLQENVQAGTQGIRDVKLFGMTDDLLGEFHDIVDRYTRASVAVRRNQSAISSFYRFAVSLLLFGLLYAAITYRALSISALGVFLFAMFRLAPQISTLNSIIYQIEGDLPHLVRTHAFVDRLRANQEVDSGTRPVPDGIREISFEDVEFGYGDEPVLRGLSMTVQAGEFVGIVGRSGEGKSTVVSLLARIYDPDDGAIRADGVDLSAFDLRAWREAVALVRQDPHIFNDTLRYNLTTGRAVDDDELRAVAATARVDDFADQLPDGYETVLGDDGVKLSGGQRQRVALARALLTDAQVLVLDEATSDLDSRLERDIHRTIGQLDGDRTVVAIAHRLSTISSADRIYTVEDGGIAEVGTHDELLGADGTYAELYSIQGAQPVPVHDD